MTRKDERDSQAKIEDPSEIPVPEDISQHGLPVPQAVEDTPDETEAPAPVTDESGVPFHDWPQRARFSQDVQVYLRDLIRLADQKATFFFAGGTALLAFLFANGGVGLWIKPIIEWNVIDMIAFIATSSLIVSVLLAVWVVIPRTGGSRRGPIFWEAIAEYRSAREYADDVVTRSDASLTRARAEHCFDLAVVCKKKYNVLRVALSAGAIGLAASLSLFLVL